jgi:hypothetical protein
LLFFFNTYNRKRRILSREKGVFGHDRIVQSYFRTPILKKHKPVGAALRRERMAPEGAPIEHSNFISSN